MFSLVGWLLCYGLLFGFYFDALLWLLDGLCGGFGLGLFRSVYVVLWFYGVGCCLMVLVACFLFGFICVGCLITLFVDVVATLSWY